VVPFNLVHPVLWLMSPLCQRQRQWYRVIRQSSNVWERDTLTFYTCAKRLISSTSSHLHTAHKNSGLALRIVTASCGEKRRASMKWWHDRIAATVSEVNIACAIFCDVLCRRYMWNRIISKLFQPSSMSRPK